MNAPPGPSIPSGNPVLPGWRADPELHLFDAPDPADGRRRYYLYPTFSAPYEEQTFFEAWSSPDLVTWRNEGRILDFADVPWSTNRAAWAPSMLHHGGRYFFYFSAGDGAGLGVAVSDSPIGPFADALGHPLVAEYHRGAQPIDAHAFTDDDGRAYLYWGGWGHALVAELGEDRTSLVGEIHEITPPHYVEGPFMLKRRGSRDVNPGGEYVFMWSEGGWGDDTYAVAYGRADTPFGPFPREGVVLKGDPPGPGCVGKSAGHHSVLRLPGDEERYVVAYHRRPPEETSAHHRVVCLDRLEFAPDGRILPVTITREGVAGCPAEGVSERG